MNRIYILYLSLGQKLRMTDFTDRTGDKDKYKSKYKSNKRQKSKSKEKKKSRYPKDKSKKKLKKFKDKSKNKSDGGRSDGYYEKLAKLTKKKKKRSRYPKDKPKLDNVLSTNRKDEWVESATINSVESLNSWSHSFSESVEKCRKRSKSRSKGAEPQLKRVKGMQNCGYSLKIANEESWADISYETDSSD